MQGPVVPKTVQPRNALVDRIYQRVNLLRGYAAVIALKMYYEIEGTGDPLVCIPPAFGYAGVNPYFLTEAEKLAQSRQPFPGCTQSG
jgi:hypothetical protein